MSGETGPQAAPARESLERAFGETAACSRCGARVPAYRVVAHFLHQTVAIRAYCPACYPRVEGEYHAGGDGALLPYEEFASRFGAPGSPPPPTTRVDSILVRLMGQPDLARLVPPSEALARRTRSTPYTFEVGVRVGDEVRPVMLALEPDGSVASLQGEPVACDRVRTMLV